MRGYNPAITTYLNFDIDKIIGEEITEKPTKGLLAPKRTMGSSTDRINNPIFRVAKHMQVLRKKREEFKNA
mgnify:CR=1 FL=1|tara:strand:+ start:169 stop:381 length:213 start_codon:yes stop_codon:yes gene_type:complete